MSGAVDMADVIHIMASPSGPASRSNEVAQELLTAYQGIHPRRKIHTLDVWNMELPAFDAAMIAAKFAVLRSQEATEDQRAKWAQAVAISNLFNQAGSYVFSLPMWNFGVPYRLKHFIDVITLPGQNWTWTPHTGYRPLLSDKRAVLVYSSAGEHPLEPADPTGSEDFQKPFMRRWLRFLGVDVVDEIVVGPTLGDPQRLAALLLDRKTAARRAARML